ncbi:hypothetical protein [Pseudonocardia asaccharolytica]|uniref:Lipoprotein n=1 Tax=Pseudonocardia asaccharolytica DSM 44247 = NBRC 16224 TaxID=1123024 RepID=A0A511D0D0_9PSEU|nr:hypothetical protein [Pseudonocardia asaccharolytica]GEL18255.1 hypothetical protein PA7_20920 [Pseudonocardia asaccharolytica DSM 44247 = NBRC 16224]
MSSPTRPVRLALAACAAFLAAGCSTLTGGSPQADPVAWVDSVCGATLPFNDAATATPNLQFSDPAAAVQSLSGYLESTGTAVQGTLDSLDAVGPSPIEGGDAAVEQLQSLLTGVKQAFDTTRTTLGSVDTSSPETLTATLPAALAPMEDLRRLVEGTAALEVSPEFRAAAEQASNCRKMPDLFGG